MTIDDRMRATIAGKHDGVPLFSPAIYDLKPSLADVPPHEYGQNADEVAYALTREATELGNDILVSAYDIYNVEAEALGCAVHRSEDMPMPKIVSPMIDTLADIEKLSAPKEPVGRMNVFIEAATTIQRKFPGAVIVGGISGPFSIASHVYPKEKLLMGMMTEPDDMAKLLRVCTDTVLAYARGFSERGIGVFVFDSFIAPPLLSPDLYASMVLPFHREIVSAIHAGAEIAALISGGNTLPIFPLMTSSGADHYILDYPIPVHEMKRVLETVKAAIRINIDPQVISEGTPASITAHMKSVLSSLGGHGNCIVGSGILPMHTPIGNIQAARRALKEHYRR